MKRSSIVVFALALIGIVRANDQQTQQAWLNAAICLLAVRSGLSPDPRSDLQLQHTSLAVRRGLALNTYDQTCELKLERLDVSYPNEARGVFPA